MLGFLLLAKYLGLKVLLVLALAGAMALFLVKQAARLLHRPGMV
jgi:hypothetical protein